MLEKSKTIDNSAKGAEALPLSQEAGSAIARLIVEQAGTWDLVAAEVIDEISKIIGDDTEHPARS